MHGARVIALQGNFDQALELVRRLVESHPIALVNSVNDFRIEGQKTGVRARDELGEPPDALCIPVGNAGNVTSWWKAFWSVRPPRCCMASRPRAPRRSCWRPRRAPETVASAIRIGNPARWEDAMGAFTASRGQVRSVSDAEILDAYSLLGARGSSASRHPRPVAGLLKYGAEGRVVCVLTGHGLKDPQTAMSRAAGGPMRARPRGRAARRARMRRHRIVRVPASSANLGPGYDARRRPVAVAGARGRGDRRVPRAPLAGRRARRPDELCACAGSRRSIPRTG